MAVITEDALVGSIADSEILTSLAAEELTASITDMDMLGMLPLTELGRVGPEEISQELFRYYFLTENTHIIYYINGPQFHGPLPYRTIKPAPQEKVIIDCSVEMGLIIDATDVGGSWGYLPIETVNWPEDQLGVVHLLINVPPAGVAIGWPEATWRPYPMVSVNSNCEYELRSWDGGRTIVARLIATYPYSV